MDCMAKIIAGNIVCYQVAKDKNLNINLYAAKNWLLEARQGWLWNKRKFTTDIYHDWEHWQKQTFESEIKTHMTGMNLTLAVLDEMG